MRGEWEITERSDLQGVRKVILSLSDVEGMSIYQMSRKAGLSHTTLWGILHRDGRKDGNTVHRRTLKKMGDGLGYDVLFNTGEGTVKFSKQFSNYPDVSEEQVDSRAPIACASDDAYPAAPPIDLEEIRNLW